MKIRTALLLSIVMLVLSACAYQQVDPKKPPLVKGKIETPEVRLQVVQGQLEVKNSSTPNCSGGNVSAKGCIVTGLEDIAFVRFVLQGSGQYNLTRIWVCEGANKPKFRDPEDHDSLDCELLGDRANEFIVITGGSVSKPDSKGEVLLGDVDEFFLLNQNSFEAEYFYLIEACKKNSKTDCTALDPRLINGGRGISL